MARGDAPQLIAGGTINPCTFVKMSAAADFTLLACGDNEDPCGIAAEAAQDAPIPGAGADAAAAGEHFEHYTLGDVCLLVAGSGGWTAGDYLKSDTNGAGVTILGTGTVVQKIGAQALETVAATAKGMVKIVRLNHRPALS